MIEEFFYRRFIPEENRGGTYHVTLLIDGKLVGPMTPAEADKRGFSMSAIFADIDAQLAMAVTIERDKTDALQTAMDAVEETLKRERANAAFAIDSANAIIEKMSAFVPNDKREEITRDIIRLNAAMDGVKVETIEGVKDGEQV